MTSDPTTAAGRALLERWKRRLRGMPSLDGLLTGHDIAQIEDEARADAAIWWTDQLAVEKDRVTRLRGHLLKTQHLRGCSVLMPIDSDHCTCGLRDLLAETTPAEPQPFDEVDNMCPNCVTPWKCNGPHLSEQTVDEIARLRDALSTILAAEPGPLSWDGWRFAHELQGIAAGALLAETAPVEPQP